MTMLAEGSETLAVVPLHGGSEAEVRALLEPQPVANVYMLGELDDDGLDGRGEWIGVRDRGQLAALALLGASGLLTGHQRAPGMFAALAPWLTRRASSVRLLVGEASAIASLWEPLARRSPGLRWQRAQRVYELGRNAGAGGGIETVGMRMAGAGDEKLAVAATAAMHLEEMGEDPLAINPMGWRARITQKIGRGRLFIWLEGGELRFTAGLSAETARVAQIDGVYTAPRWRSQGIARLALVRMAALLFSTRPQLERVSLFVNDTNVAAIRAYEAAGFRPTLPYTSIRTLS